MLAELELKTDAFFTIFSRIICSSNVLQLGIISVTYGKNKYGSGHYGSFHKFGLQVIQQLRRPNLTQLWPDDPQPLLRGKTSTFYNNVSSVVEFQRWWVLKGKIFGQESTYLKDLKKKICRWITLSQKVPKLYFQSQFSMSKINRLFSKKNSS